MMIRALVFDFGKVIGMFDHKITVQKLAQRSVLPPDQIYDRIYKSHLEDEFESGRMSTEEFLQQVYDLCEITCAREELKNILQDIFWPNEKICLLIPRLKNAYPLYLASNTNDLH